LIITCKSNGLGFKWNPSLLVMVMVVCSLATIAIMALPPGIITFLYSRSFSLLGSAKADSMVDAIRVGNGPMGIDYDSDNGNMYVANFYSNTVSVIDSNTNNVIATIPFASNTSPIDIAFDSSNGNLYVTNYNTGTVSVINGNTNRVISTIFVGGNPTAIAVNYANGDVYVADGVNAVRVINPITNRLVHTVSVGYGPSGIAFDSDNGNMYVANFYSNTVSVIDGNTNNVIRTIPMLLDSANPSGIVYNPTDKHLYVINYYSLGNRGSGGGGTVSIINDYTNNIIANIAVGNSPQDGAFNSANGQVYFTNLLSNTVSVISSSSRINPVQSIQDLIQTIQSMGTISQDVQIRLISILNTAISILSTNNPGRYIAACNQLDVFNNQVYDGVQTGLIDQSSGIQLVQSSQAIQQVRGC
jgi:YVTN family beta-propeller protein